LIVGKLDREKKLKKKVLKISFNCLKKKLFDNSRDGADDRLKHHLQRKIKHCGLHGSNLNSLDKRKTNISESETDEN
jgi:hypothetical protein